MDEIGASESPKMVAAGALLVWNSNSVLKYAAVIDINLRIQGSMCQHEKDSKQSRNRFKDRDYRWWSGRVLFFAIFVALW